MAKQFSATVQEQSVSFPSSLVRIIGLTEGSNIEYLGAIYLADEAASDLIDAANTDGTEQVLATILRVNDAVQTFPIVMGFPASLINIYSSSLSGSQSVIVYNNVFYYAEESQFDLETAANTGGGSGGVTIYTGDGSLNGNRTVTLNDNQLIFNQHGVPALIINSYNATTGWGVEMQAQVGANNTLVSIDAGNVPVLNMVSTDGTHNTQIEFDPTGNADLGFSGIAYTADTHTFNGVINLPTQAAPASPNDGDIWREDNTNTGLKIRINGVTKTIVVS